MGAPFTAIAGLFVAAERCGEVGALAIDLDLARADAIGHLGGFSRLTLNIAGQAILGVIGHFDGFIDAVIRNHHHHRPEDFFPCNGHVIGDIRKHGRPGEIAAIEAFRATRAARDQGRALVDAFLDQVLNLGILIAVRDRTDGAFVGFARHLHFHRFCSRLGDRLGFFIAAARNEHPAWRVTGLTGIGHHLHDAAANGFLKIGAWQDDVRRLAAQLLGDAFHSRRRGLRHQNTSTGRAGKAHHVDIRMA